MKLFTALALSAGVLLWAGHAHASPCRTSSANCYRALQKQSDPEVGRNRWAGGYGTYRVYRPYRVYPIAPLPCIFGCSSRKVHEGDTRTASDGTVLAYSKERGWYVAYKPSSTAN